MKHFTATFKALIILSIFIPGLTTAGYTNEHYLHTPADKVTVKNDMTSVMFNFGGNTIDTSRLKVFLNGNDITDSLMIGDGFFTYMPIDPLPGGENRVLVHFTDSENSEKEYLWIFNVQPVSSIEDVSFDAPEAAMEGDEIEVTVQADPDGRVEYSIEDVVRNRVMKEVSPGVYKETYTVKRGDHLDSGYVTARHVSKDGTISRAQSGKTLDINARFFMVKLLEPEAGANVNQSFLVRGRTAPNTPVFIEASLSLNMGGSHAPVGKPNPLKAFSDEKGYFEYTLSFPISISGLMSIIRVWAIGPDGERSMPDQTTVYLKPGEAEKDKAENETGGSEENKE